MDATFFNMIRLIGNYVTHRLSSFTVADHTWKNKPVHGMKISAVVIITVALMLLLIPHKYPERLSKFCSKCLQDDTPPPPHERPHRLEEEQRQGHVIHSHVDKSGLWEFEIPKKSGIYIEMEDS